MSLTDDITAVLGVARRCEILGVEHEKLREYELQILEIIAKK